MDRAAVLLAKLRREIALGMQQADRGEFVDGRKAFESIRAKSIQRRTGKKMGLQPEDL
jgi:hypothetical protein